MTTVTVPLGDENNQPSGETVDIPAEPVCPGLAITPSVDKGGRIFDGWWALTHTPSGLRVSGWKRTCRRHIEQLAELAARSGVDWTQPADAVRADARAKDVSVESVFRFGPCDASECRGGFSVHDEGPDREGAAR
jgi:hypothetical protein